MVDWPENDLIKWVEMRVRAFEVSRENLKNGWGAEGPDHPLSELDLKIWLAHIRDKMSQSVIAKELYRREWDRSRGKRNNQAAISRIRRAIDRVEKFLNREGKDFVYPKKMRDQMDAGLRDYLFRPPW